MSTIQRLEAFDAFYDAVHRHVVAEVLQPAPEMKVLDVGCGAGGMSVLLAQAVTCGVVVALDPNAAHLHTTRMRAQQGGCAQRIVCLLGHVEKLDFLASEFDLIWCSRVIHHHLPDPHGALSELYRVLKPGKRVFLREHANTDLRVVTTIAAADAEFWQRLCNAQQQWFQSKFKHRRPTSDEWLTALTQVGFRDAKTMHLEYTPARPRAQVIYLRQWLETVLEDHASPEYGDLLNPSDLLTAQLVAAYLDRASQESDDDATHHHQVIVSTDICVAVK